MAEDYVIEMLHITKEFPGIKANDDITLQLRRGEVHALLGENGAGKSTLMSVLFGLYQPEQGKILKDGKEVQIRNPNDANALGIGMVHQHFKLVDVFSAADNIWMGAQEAGFVLKKDRYRKIEEMAKKFGEGVRVNAIAPGFFLTEQNRTLLTNPDGSLTDRSRDIIAATPYGRFGEPEELNGTLGWLASDASAFVTGVVVPVDGGFSIFSGV